jgi:hypothetical protein
MSKSQSPWLLPGPPVAVSVAVCPTFMVAGSPVNESDERRGGRTAYDPNNRYDCGKSLTLSLGSYTEPPFFQVLWLLAEELSRLRRPGRPPPFGHFGHFILKHKPVQKSRGGGPGLGPLLFSLIASAKPR